MSEGLVGAELEPVLGSETFAPSESLKRFLRHVVEAKLGGREGDLKEQVLGAGVFGRGDSCDPRLDPIVRVQATRLRSKLRDYYQAEGARSELTIELPKGGYLPSFARTPSGDEKAPKPRGKMLPVTIVTVGLLVLLGGWWIWKGGDAPPSPAPRSVAVLPFTDMSPGGDHEYFGDGLAEEITTALASIEELDVVRAVEKNLADPQRADRHRPSPRAYDDFLRGTFERERSTPLSLARSIKLFESAIEDNPDFAPAHAGLVHSYVLSLLWGFAPSSETRDAAREIDRARSRSRQRPLPHYLGAVIAFQRGEHESALERSRAILDWAPDHALTWLLLSRIQDRLGRFAEAEASLSSFEASAQAPAFASAYRAIFRSHQGRSDEAAAELLKLEELRTRGYVPPALLARVFASRGEEDEALHALEAAEAEHSFSLVFLAVDPDFEPLRPNPRFRALIERLGLAVS